VTIDPNFARWLLCAEAGCGGPACACRDLPAIDLVLVTHAHFDHLHRPSLRRHRAEQSAHPRNCTGIIIPSHVTDLVSDLGFSEIIELDWWNSSRHGSLSVTHVPSRHWGARILKDRTAAYGGYVLAGREAFCVSRGDTAYFAASAKSEATGAGNWRCFLSVIHRMLPCPQHIAAVAAVRILEDACSPMPGRNVGHRQAAVPRTVPPVEFDNFGEAQIGNQVCDVLGMMMAGAVPRVRRLFCTMARNDGRCR